MKNRDIIKEKAVIVTTIGPHGQGDKESLESILKRKKKESDNGEMWWGYGLVNTYWHTPEVVRKFCSEEKEVYVLFIPISDINELNKGADRTGYCKEEYASNPAYWRQTYINPQNNEIEKIKDAHKWIYIGKASKVALVCEDFTVFKYHASDGRTPQLVNLNLYNEINIKNYSQDLFDKRFKNKYGIYNAPLSDYWVKHKRPGLLCAKYVGDDTKLEYRKKCWAIAKLKHPYAVKLDVANARKLAAWETEELTMRLRQHCW